jgi:ArsR family transcriptional regulator, virulence genes transcriptional regulator
MKSMTLDPALFRERAGEAAKLLRAMASEHRLMILCRLGGGEFSAGDLLAGTTLSQSALSQHLAVLREDGLVATRRAGQSIFYRIADPSALRIIETLAGIFCPEE